MGENREIFQSWEMIMDEIRDQRKLREAQVADSANDWDIEACLVDLLNDVRQGRAKYRKMIIILNDCACCQVGNTSITYRHVKADYMEALGIMELHKSLMLERMQKGIEEY